MVHRPQSAGGRSRLAPRFIRNAFPTAPRRPGTAHAPRPGVDPSHCFQHGRSAASTPSLVGHDEDGEYRQTTSKPSKQYSAAFDFNKCLSRDESVVDGRKRSETTPEVTAATALDAMYIDRSQTHFTSTSSVPSYRLRNCHFDKCIDRSQRSKADRFATALTRAPSGHGQQHKQQQEGLDDNNEDEKKGKGFAYVVVGAGGSNVRSRKIVVNMERQSGRTHHNSIMFDVQGSKQTATAGGVGASSSSLSFDGTSASIRGDAEYVGRFQLPFYSISYSCMDRNVAIPQFQTASQLSSKQKKLRDETLQKASEAARRATPSVGGGPAEAKPVVTTATAAAALEQHEGEQHDIYRAVERRMPGALDFGKMCGKTGHVNGAKPLNDPQLTAGGWTPSFGTQERRLQNINIGKSSPRKPPSIGRKFNDIKLNPKFHLVEKTVITPRIPPVSSHESHPHHHHHHHDSQQQHNSSGASKKRPASAASRPTSASSSSKQLLHGQRPPSCTYALDLDITKADRIVHPCTIRNIKFVPAEKKGEVEAEEDAQMLFPGAGTTA